MLGYFKKIRAQKEQVIKERKEREDQEENEFIDRVDECDSINEFIKLREEAWDKRYNYLVTIPLMCAKERSLLDKLDKEQVRKYRKDTGYRF